MASPYSKPKTLTVRSGISVSAPTTMSRQDMVRFGMSEADLEKNRMRAISPTPSIKNTLAGTSQYNDLLGRQQKAYAIKPVTSLSTMNAKKIVDRGQKYLEETYNRPSRTETARPETPKSAKFVNEAGQEVTYTEDQLNNPSIRSFLSNGGYAMAEGAGVFFDPTQSGLQNDIDRYSSEIESVIANFDKYDVNEDPEFQDIADDIRSEFSVLRDNLQKANYSRAQAMQTMGYRLGTAQYAGGIQQLIESEELTQANNRMTELERQEKQALSAARSAIKTGKYAEFNQRINNLQALREQKADELANYNKVLADFNNRAVEARKLEQQEADFQLKQQQTYSELFAPLMTGTDENGNIISPTPEQVRLLSREYGIDPNILMSKISQREDELRKMTLSERQFQLSVDQAKNSLLTSDIKEFEYLRRTGEIPDTMSFLDYQADKIERDLTEKFKELLTPAEAEKLGVPYGTTRGEAFGITPEDTGLNKEEMALRKEFHSLPEVESYFDLNRSYTGLRSSFDAALSKNATKDSKAAADQALVTLFNKMLDPTSVVREGEYARSFEGQSALARAQGYYERLVTGGAGLTDANRKDMVDIAEKLYKDAQNKYKKTEGFYKKLASDYGLNPDNVIGRGASAEIGETATKPQTPQQYQAVVEAVYLSSPENERVINTLMSELINETGGVDYQDLYNLLEPYFNQVGGDTQAAANRPYLSTLGQITGLDGSKYWKWGLDVDLKKGDPVKSPVTGTVVATQENGGFGKQVRIRDEQGREWWLSHLDGYDVRPGQKIAAGTIIGKGGNTGKVYSETGGDGSHLDITVKDTSGKYIPARQVKSLLDNVKV